MYVCGVGAVGCSVGACMRVVWNVGCSGVACGCACVFCSVSVDRGMALRQEGQVREMLPKVVACQANNCLSTLSNRAIW